MLQRQNVFVYIIHINLERTWTTLFHNEIKTDTYP